jgi:hypothetical protein
VNVSEGEVFEHVAMLAAWQRHEFVPTVGSTPYEKHTTKFVTQIDDAEEGVPNEGPHPPPKEGRRRELERR